MTSYWKVPVGGLLLAIAVSACGDNEPDAEASEFGSDVVPFEPTEELDEAPPIPLESPITSLRVRLESLPDEVPAGEDLVFVAVLENPTDEDVVLNPCPAYLINYGESSELVSTGLMLLNCDDGDRIPAGESLSFEMRISTASDEIRPGERNTLVWRLEPDLTRAMEVVQTS